MQTFAAQLCRIDCPPAIVSRPSVSVGGGRSLTSCHVLPHCRPASPRPTLLRATLSPNASRCQQSSTHHHPPSASLRLPLQLPDMEDSRAPPPVLRLAVAGNDSLSCWLIPSNKEARSAPGINTTRLIPYARDHTCGHMAIPTERRRAHADAGP
jgi:hypothetical protein